MPHLIPPRTPVAAMRASDPRLGHLFGTAVEKDAIPRAVLVGFPADDGVRRNGGRTGAAGAPSAIREALYRLAPDARDLERFTHLATRTVDLGDVLVTGDLERDQQSLGEIVAEQLARGTFCIVLGGGHESTYGHFLAYAAAGARVSVLNWDAHPDVREMTDGRGHSGSPFRQALLHESGVCQGYTVAGVQPHAVAGGHLEFLRTHGGRCIHLEDLTDDAMRQAYEGTGDLLVSFDLDLVDQAYAPGVSAPATAGLDPARWLRAAELAGASPRVRSTDIVELNPLFDRDGQTARLAALTVWRMLRGLASRGR